METSPSSWRELFKTATDAEAFLQSDALRAIIQNEEIGPGNADWTSRLSNWKEKQYAKYLPIFERAKSEDCMLEVRRAILRATNIFASTLGCWVQNLTAPCVFESAFYLKSLVLLASDVGVGQPESSRYDEFKTLLRSQELSEIALPMNELHGLAEIDDIYFELAAVMLSMSRRSDQFLPELCGFDACLRRMKILCCWGALSKDIPKVINWNRLDLSSNSIENDNHDLLDLSACIETSCRTHSADYGARLDNAAAYCLSRLMALEDSVIENCMNALSPDWAMANLIKSRAREARIYHQNYELNGKTIATWFSEARYDPSPFIEALSKSNLVRPGKPERSFLLNGLLDLNGSMFRVFGNEDLRILRRWIKSLADGKVRQHITPSLNLPAMRLVPAGLKGISKSLEAGLEPIDIRDAYFRLQGRSINPELRSFTTKYIEFWLKRSEKSMKNRGNILPPTWVEGQLSAWLLDEHEKNDAKYRTDIELALPEKTEVVDSTLQLAPLTLIDGSWLQGFTDIQLASSRTGFSLFQTYWDELGNGSYELNHPKIYRDVLRGMGLELPPTGSREFAYDPRLRDESFALPVYWLCLGKSAMSYLSIILGMNLAMELSGVGGGYRSARRFLEHYGFSTLFVDLHNTIDNVATGHSAWAVRAIDTHMRSIYGLRDQGLLASEWKKVLVGYESLSPTATRRMKQGYFGTLSYWFSQKAVSKAETQPLHHQDIGMAKVQ